MTDKPEATISTEKDHDEKEESSSSSDEEGHHHHEGDGHDHSGHAHAKAGDKKTNKGEKKLKKAMSKLGMKPVTGINRVTIKKAKAVLLYIEDPEILKSPGADNTYVVFGEVKLQDYPGTLG